MNGEKKELNAKPGSEEEEVHIIMNASDQAENVVNIYFCCDEDFDK